MLVRPMRPEDLLPVVAVWRRSRIDANPSLEARMQHTPDDDLRHFRDVVVPGDRVWVAETDAAIVGLMALHDDLLGRLYVDPPAQGGGVGSALLDLAKSLCPAGITLFTHEANRRARRFYARRGFREVAFGVSPAPESEPDMKLRWEPGEPPRVT
jgi:putative acetyltransferase